MTDQMNTSGLVRQLGERTSLLLDRFSTMIGHSVAWLTLLMVLFTALNVTASWLFNKSWIALSESVTWLHAINFLLAAAYTLNKDEQVRVDILYQKFSVRGQAWVNLLGSLLLLMPVAVFVFWASLPYVTLSFRISEASAEAGGLPFLFLLKSLLLVMPVLLLLEGVNQILKSLLLLSAGPVDPDADNPALSNQETC